MCVTLKIFVRELKSMINQIINTTYMLFEINKYYKLESSNLYNCRFEMLKILVNRLNGLNT